jgi:hypothetical protein
MTDMIDTRNHVIRRNIGEINFSNQTDFVKASANKKFPDTIEHLVENWMKDKLKVTVLAVELGRKELEEYLYDKYKPKYNNKGKRIGKKTRQEKTIELLKKVKL